jgi:hypothetical protein
MFRYKNKLRTTECHKSDFNHNKRLLFHYFISERVPTFFLFVNLHSWELFIILKAFISRKNTRNTKKNVCSSYCAVCFFFFLAIVHATSSPIFAQRHTYVLDKITPDFVPNACKHAAYCELQCATGPAMARPHPQWIGSHPPPKNLPNRHLPQGRKINCATSRTTLNYHLLSQRLSSQALPGQDHQARHPEKSRQ